MSREKILKAVGDEPITLDDIVTKSKVPKSSAYRLMQTLREEGTILTLPTSPVTYVRVEGGRRSVLFEEMLEQALPNVNAAIYKMEGLWLEWIISGQVDEEALFKVNRFLNRLMGSIVFLQDGFKNKVPSEPPTKELFKRYQERKLKEHDAK